jgi:1-aminocyclopropane-1-carboxylate deaminase
MFPDESTTIDPALATTDRLELPEFARQGIRADTLRLDKIHPIISGNKWFKLKEHLRLAVEKKASRIVTFGGAWSNHIVATAFAARQAGLQATGIIRGERADLPSAALRDAAAYGMNLEFVSREEYKKKEELDFLNRLSAAHPDAYILPEGGAGPPGIKGSEEIGRLAAKGQYTHLLCAIGTGTMYQGIARSCTPRQQVMGIPVLKGLQPPVSSTGLYHLPMNYHFGGYARKTEELLQFMRDLYKNTGIPTDFVYTGKLFYAALDMANKGIFPPGSEILIIHSGGLQGNRSLPPGTLDF